MSGKDPQLNTNLSPNSSLLPQVEKLMRVCEVSRVQGGDWVGEKKMEEEKEKKKHEEETMLSRETKWYFLKEAEN